MVARKQTSASTKPKPIHLVTGFWLFKSEPECFSIDHLAAKKGGVGGWDGVRNFQARNYLRDHVKVGDQVLFHYSSVQPAGVVGLCEVVRSGYPDETARDPKSEHYDPKATKDNPIWYQVDIKFVQKFKRMITLSELRETPGLGNMMVVQRGARLSIQPVTADEWSVIMKLVASL